MTLRSDRRAGSGVEVHVLFGSGGEPRRALDLHARTGRPVDELAFHDADSGPAHPADGPVEEPAAAEPGGEATRLSAAQEFSRAEGFEEARRYFGEELQSRLEAERERIERVRLEFARDRQRFFAAAESQVVRLALAVARRVLARDAELAGLPLRATVKAALARVQDGSRTVLRIPVDEQDAWRAIFEQDGAAPGSLAQVEVVPDTSLSPGECTLETGVGRIELGVEVQMSEIERGFRELMQHQESE